MQLVLGQDEAVAHWVARQLGFDDPHFFGPSRAILIATGADEPMAGIVFHSYRDLYKSCDISMAAVSPRWATRGVIHALLSYPFDQLKCQRVQVTIPLKNARARRFCKGIGFVQEGIIRRGFGADHAVIMGMLDREFRSLFKGKRNVKEIAIRSRAA